MPMTLLRRLALTLTLAAAAGAAQGAAGAAELAAEHARWSDFHAFAVSPSNTHAAFLAERKNGRMALAVIDLADPSKRQLIASHDDADIFEVQWVNDRRLVYYAQAPFESLGYGKWGTFVIDRDGSEHRELISAKSDGAAATGSAIRTRVLPRGWVVHAPVGDGSDDLIVLRMRDSLGQGYSPQDVARVDTRSLRLTMLALDRPEGATGWVFDRRGQLRAVSAVQKDREQLWWKPEGDAAWRLLESWPAYTGQGMVPLALEADGTLIVSARLGGDTAALHTYDPAAGKIDPKPLVTVQGFDVDGGVVLDRQAGRVVGVHVQAQHWASIWFEDRLAQAQAAVDRALPVGRNNFLRCGHCASATRFVVLSMSDRQPGEYHLYDAAAGKLTWLGQSRAWIDEKRQGRRSFHRVAARDGLALPVVVTHPAGAADDQPLPTVLLVHGGPWVRGTGTDWSAEPQFLAARGYRVLEVDFRGSTGLGWRHFHAGWGTWGLAMQDDLEDALQWAVGAKLVDPGRVCIYGGSYGGYAALMGPVRHPGRYRCAVSHAGVTDIALLYSGNWTDMGASFRTYGLPLLVGDLERDAERLRRTSPLHRVADIKVPLLVVQGRHDERVDPVHADRFVGAARAAGVDVTRLDYEAAHWWPDAATHAKFLTELDRFLARHLKPAPN